jgi:hypothetical protein
MSRTALKPAYATRIAKRPRMLVAKSTTTIRDEDATPEHLVARGMSLPGRSARPPGSPAAGAYTGPVEAVDPAVTQAHERS